MTIELPSFTLREIDNLAQRHQLQLTVAEREQLRELTGGFPYLVRLALYETVQSNIPLTKLLTTGTSETGIFSKQLHYLLWNLQQKSNLWSGFQQVLKSPTHLETEVAFKLASLGLINLEENEAKVSCGLYKAYFQAYLAKSMKI